MKPVGATARNIAIPADLMPRMVTVEESSVILLVAGKPWNEDTKIFQQSLDNPELKG